MSAGKPKPDIWIPDSEMECFTQLADWRQLGVILSKDQQAHINSYDYWHQGSLQGSKVTGSRAVTIGGISCTATASGCSTAQLMP